MRWRAHRLRSAAASWRVRVVDAHFLAVRAFGALAFDDDAALGFAAPLAEHDHRALAEHVGKLLRFDVVDVEAFERGLHAGEHRRLDHAAKARRLLGRLERVGDDEGLAHAGARQAFHQVPVDRGADAEGEHVGLATRFLRTSSKASRSTVT